MAWSTADMARMPRVTSRTLLRREPATQAYRPPSRCGAPQAG